LILILTIFTFKSTTQSHSNGLEKAYKTKSLHLHKEFLQKWQSDSSPIKSIDSLKSTEKDGYAIFTDFYNPFKLNRIRKGEWENPLYKGLFYVIVQNVIYYNTFKTDSLNYNVNQINDDLIERREHIENFKPDIKFSNIKVLYLLPNHKGIITKFINATLT